jgi:hypothetical protein
VINAITTALTKSATIQKKKDDNRTWVETTVSSKTTASESAINAARDSLTEGVKVTRENPVLNNENIEKSHIAAEEAKPKQL